MNNRFVPILAHLIFFKLYRKARNRSSQRFDEKNKRMLNDSVGMFHSSNALLSRRTTFSTHNFMMKLRLFL